MILINGELASRDSELIALCENAIALDYKFFSSAYPEFPRWFQNRVLPGLVAGARTIAFELRGGRVAGFLILKHTTPERLVWIIEVLETTPSRYREIRRLLAGTIRQ